MATKYIYKYASGGTYSDEIDFGQLIEDNPGNTLLANKVPDSLDSFVAYVEGAEPDGLGDTIDKTGDVYDVIKFFDQICEIYGKAKASNTPEVECTLADTQYDIPVTYTNGLSSCFIIDNDNNAVVVQKDCSVSIDIAINCQTDTTADQEVSIHLYKNDTDIGVVASTGFEKKNISGVMFGFDFVEFSADDKIKLKVKNSIPSASILFNSIGIKVKCL